MNPATTPMTLVLKRGRNGALYLHAPNGQPLSGQMDVTIDNSTPGQPTVTVRFDLDGRHVKIGGDD